IEPGGEIEVAVARPGVAVDAAVLAAHVGIDGALEGYVRRSVPADDAPRFHGREHGFRRGLIRDFRFRRLHGAGREAPGGTGQRATALADPAWHDRGLLR